MRVLQMPLPRTSAENNSNITPEPMAQGMSYSDVNCNSKGESGSERCVGLDEERRKILNETTNSGLIGNADAQRTGMGSDGRCDGTSGENETSSCSGEVPISKKRRQSPPSSAPDKNAGGGRGSDPSSRGMENETHAAHIEALREQMTQSQQQQQQHLVHWHTHPNLANSLAAMSKPLPTTGKTPSKQQQAMPSPNQQSFDAASQQHPAFAAAVAASYLFYQQQQNGQGVPGASSSSSSGAGRGSGATPAFPPGSTPPIPLPPFYNPHALLGNTFSNVQSNENAHKATETGSNPPSSAEQQRQTLLANLGISGNSASTSQTFPHPMMALANQPQSAIQNIQQQPQQQQPSMQSQSTAPTTNVPSTAQICNSQHPAVSVIQQQQHQQQHDISSLSPKSNSNYSPPFLPTAVPGTFARTSAAATGAISSPNKNIQPYSGPGAPNKPHEYQQQDPNHLKFHPYSPPHSQNENSNNFKHFGKNASEHSDDSLKQHSDESDPKKKGAHLTGEGGEGGEDKRQCKNLSDAELKKQKAREKNRLHSKNSRLRKKDTINRMKEDNSFLQMYRVITEAMADMVSVHDLSNEARLIYANPSFVAKYTIPDVIPTFPFIKPFSRQNNVRVPSSFLQLVHEDDMKAVIDCLRLVRYDATQAPILSLRLLTGSTPPAPDGSRLFSMFQSRIQASAAVGTLIIVTRPLGSDNDCFRYTPKLPMGLGIGGEVSIAGTGFVV